jgi:hypothetical protein
VAVYHPGDPVSEAAALSLREDGRARLAGPGDYREGSSLDSLASAILTEVAARAHASGFVRWPDGA